MSAFYNDSDPRACAWLRELIKAGLLPEGEVDGRSITELRADDLSGFRQVHLFAGIGGWAYALRLAGWDAARPVWTGSCPCQPFSSAGRRKGEADERHLWPDFLRLVRDARPATCFGEQVSSDGGYRWLAGVRNDLEAEGYAVGAADLPACSQAAPHKRNRLFWVADLPGEGRTVQPRRSGEAGQRPADEPGRLRDAGGLGHPVEPGLERRRAGVREQPGNGAGCQPPAQAGGWSDYELVLCRDTDERGRPRARRVEPGTFPLAHGVSGRVGLLRGFGNAIVPQVAAAFVRAYLEAETELKK